ncbi:hypothetical protein [Nitrosomonas ureae]|uniref:hypothetical protein n=1 Tax=Nitrosomonas ureae TaxID=44577 RepID=UPI0011B0C041|nr:hypothetical protein [Nitrosomonas ureae]
MATDFLNFSYSLLQHQSQTQQVNDNHQSPDASLQDSRTISPYSPSTTSFQLRFNVAAVKKPQLPTQINKLILL